MIKIHLVGGKIIEGVVFAVDPVTNAMILTVGEPNEGSYVVVSANQISHIDGELSSIATPNVVGLGMKYDCYTIFKYFCNFK